MKSVEEELTAWERVGASQEKPFFTPKLAQGFACYCIISVWGLVECITGLMLLL